MMIPFFAFLNFITTIDDYQRFMLNDEYRLELTRHQPLSKPRVYIYRVKYRLFEQNTHRPSFDSIVAQVINQPQQVIDERSIRLTHVKLAKVDSQGIYIDYAIGSHHQVIFHPFHNDDAY